MSLFIVATPIGNLEDISIRALNTLRECQHVICEEPKQGKKILSSLQLGWKELYRLNEHSTEEDVLVLVELCKTEKVALISDCGTPGFCDPGSRLVAKLRELNLGIATLPGASSLMCILSLSSRRIENFDFLGFLPANKTERNKKLQFLKKSSDKNLILLETPYRLKALVADLKEFFADRTVLIGINLTGPEEQVFECLGQNVGKLKLPEKAEPVILIYAKT